MTQFKIEGLKALDEQLGRLAQSTGRGAVRRSLTKGGEPLARRMRQLAPNRLGDLTESIDVSSRAHGAKRGPRSEVTVYVGPGRHPQAITQEFGTYFHPPQPFARPAWDEKQMAVLDEVSFSLFEEILKSVDRAAARAARRG